MKSTLDDPHARRILACVDAAFSSFEKHGSTFLIRGECALLLLRADRPRLTRSIRIWTGVWFPELDSLERTAFVPGFWQWHLSHDLSAVHASTLKKCTGALGNNLEKPEWLSFDVAESETERQLAQLKTQAVPRALKWTSREFLANRLSTYQSWAARAREQARAWTTTALAEESLFAQFVFTHGVSASNEGWNTRVYGDRFRAFLATQGAS